MQSLSKMKQRKKCGTNGFTCAYDCGLSNSFTATLSLELTFYLILTVYSSMDFGLILLVLVVMLIYSKKVNVRLRARITHDIIHHSSAYTKSVGWC